MKKLVALFLLLMTTAAIADTIYVPLFQTWDPGNAVGTLNAWIVNDLDPVLQGIEDGGGGGGGGISTQYATHTALIAGTTAVGAVTLTQAGFSVIGDGGAATYNWNAASYCPGGTSGSPVAADGIVCILPSGQSSSASGRYLIQSSGNFDVRAVGMQPGGMDNSPFVPALLAVAGAIGNNNPGPVFVFPPVLGQEFTYWYFSTPFSILAGGTMDCRGYPAESSGSSILTFAPGVNGMIQETGNGFGQNDITRCTITSLGGGSAAIPTPTSTSITGITLNSPLGTGTTLTIPSSCNPLGGACTIGVGDGVILASQSVLEVAPGAYIATSTPGSGSATLASPYTILSNTVLRPSIYDLPVGQKYTVQTTLNNHTATVTAGPRPLMPGDMLWSDAFLFGATVFTVSSTTAFPQTITVADVTMTQYAPATVTHTGSSGQMWIMPAGLDRRVQGSSHQVSITRFPFGLRMSCTAGSVPQTGCNGSFDEADNITFDLVGRLARGDNSGVSTAIGNVYGANAIADEIEAGTIGSSYFSEEDNSQDSGTALYGTLTLCGINEPVFYGSYLSGQGPDACLGTDTQSNPSIAVPAAPGGPLFVGPMFGSPFPSIQAGILSGSWHFAGPQSYTVTASSATASGATVAVPLIPAIHADMGITDLTNAVIPANTTITVIGTNSVTMSNALTGGGIQIGDQIKYSALLGTGQCFTISAGFVATLPGMFFDKDCTSNTGQSLAFYGEYNAWYFGQMGLFSFDYLGYGIGGQPGIVFPNGFQIGNEASGFVGQERLIDGGSSAPTQPWHLPGDVRINNNPVVGGNLLWADVSLFNTSLTGNVTAGVTTSVSVAGCPAPAVPAGTPVIDLTGFPSPVTVISVELGTVSSCSGTTLTFQSAAVNNGASTDAIRFMQWQKTSTVQDNSTPLISSCGGGTPSLAAGSNNLAGQFTMGTGSPTACTINFAHNYPNAAFCTVTPASSGGAAITGGDYISVQNNTGFIWTLGTGTSNLTFNYTCGGN